MPARFLQWGQPPWALRAMGLLMLTAALGVHAARVTDITPRPAVKAAAWDTEPMAPQRAPRAFGGRYANAAALEDPQALSRHLAGCSMEFWRTMAREQGPLLILKPAED